MKTRNKGYREYGFENTEEAKRVIKYCRSPDFQFGQELISAAVSANKTIAYDLAYSIVNNLSYRDIAKIKYIPIGEVDFYAYRRKCVANMLDWLRMNRITF